MELWALASLIGNKNISGRKANERDLYLVIGKKRDIRTGATLRGSFLVWKEVDVVELKVPARYPGQGPYL